MSITTEAPLSKLPLFVPAGGILPLAGRVSRQTLHDEPSRELRVFPGPGTGESRFELIEDDGISRFGPVTRVAITLRWTPERVMVQAQARGGHQAQASSRPLPRCVPACVPVPRRAAYRAGRVWTGGLDRSADYRAV